MSAIRSNSSRSEARKMRSTPYARGLIGTISRVINYFSGTPSEQSMEIDEDNNGQSNGSQPQIVPSKYDFSSGIHATLTPSDIQNRSCSTLPEPSSLPVPNSEQVASYFSQRMGTNVTPNEVESMVNNLQTSPERERFRFIFTTPIRSSSPSFTPSNFNSAASPTPTPSKKLARNPNGIYRWEGGGSAKAARQRNRFASPAFGASPVKASRLPTQENGGPLTLPGQDNKRRKVGDSSNGQPSTLRPSATDRVPFPSVPSTPRTNGVLRQTTPLPSSRLRTPTKATAPVNPSPLRQAWSDASSASSGDNKSSPTTKPTKAANLVAELIKETAPPIKPDLSNPYQTASPVSKVGPPRRATKRPRAVGRPSLPTKEHKAEEQKKEEEEKLKALSAQAIIEATLPKGSKRSRAPAHLENKSVADAPRSPSPTRHASVSTEAMTHTVEEEEVSERPKKKSRSSSEEPSQPKALLADATVEHIEDEDVDMDKDKAVNPASSSNQLSRATQLPTSLKPSSVPREPSKLRFSFQAESSSSSSTPVAKPVPLPAFSTGDQATSSISVVPAPPPPSIQTISNGFNFSFRSPSISVTPPQEKKTDLIVSETKSSPDVDVVKMHVRAIGIKALPIFVFSAETATLSSVLEHINAREAAQAFQLSSLPSFSFNSPTKSFSFSFDPANPKSTGSFPINNSPSNFKPFAGIKAPTISPSNIFGAIPSTSTVVETPVDFKFAATGMKPPVDAKGTWKCSHCGLSSPQEATTCTICNEPKQGSALSTPAVVLASELPVMKQTQTAKSFDWAAAGAQPPSTNNDTWTCGVCGLSSPKSATKCTVCDADAPGTVSSTPLASTKAAMSSTNMFAALAAKPASSFERV